MTRSSWESVTPTSVPALMVGQNLENEAAHARATRTFEDVEEARKNLRTVLDELDCHTQGGLKTILEAIEKLAAARERRAP